MDIIKILVSRRPYLSKDIRTAKINKTPEKVVKDSVNISFLMTITFAFFLHFFIPFFQDITRVLIAIPIMLIVFYNYSLLSVHAAIMKRRKDIDRDVLFAGRYLLIKLNSGTPLINSLIEASESYGTAEKYFKQIVKDIELGKPVEDALSEEAYFCPSEKFKKILFQISNALKIGIDVTNFLEATIDEIADEQITEIRRYGKKLNSITLFYMLLGVVLPSLGMTLFVVVANLANLDVGAAFFGAALLVILVVQLLFLMIYKNIRPDINI